LINNLKSGKNAGNPKPNGTRERYFDSVCTVGTAHPKRSSKEHILRLMDSFFTKKK
jgi:hypothetical protein